MKGKEKVKVIDWKMVDTHVGNLLNNPPSDEDINKPGKKE